MCCRAGRGPPRPGSCPCRPPGREPAPPARRGPDGAGGGGSGGGGPGRVRGDAEGRGGGEGGPPAAPGKGPGLRGPRGKPGGNAAAVGGRAPGMPRRGGRGRRDPAPLPPPRLVRHRHRHRHWQRDRFCPPRSASPPPVQASPPRDPRPRLGTVAVPPALAAGPGPGRALEASRCPGPGGFPRGGAASGCSRSPAKTPGPAAPVPGAGAGDAPRPLLTLPVLPPTIWVGPCAAPRPQGPVPVLPPTPVPVPAAPQDRGTRWQHRPGHQPRHRRSPPPRVPQRGAPAARRRGVPGGPGGSRTGNPPPPGEDGAGRGRGGLKGSSPSRETKPWAWLGNVRHFGDTGGIMSPLGCCGHPCPATTGPLLGKKCPRCHPAVGHHLGFGAWFKAWGTDTWVGHKVWEKGQRKTGRGMQDVFCPSPEAEWWWQGCRCLQGQREGTWSRTMSV